MTVATASGDTVYGRRAAPLRHTLLCSTVLVATAHLAAAQPAINAQPQGGRVVAGTATIGQTSTLTEIDQTSQRAAVNWSSFDVGSKQQVRFQQPSPSAMTLNRVTGADPSQIAGKITANGQIVLVNPAGVLFTKGAQVEAQSVVVSAAGISDQNFMAGRMVFDQSARPDAAVVNRGRITVKQTGLAGLVAPRVQNDGVISARLGHVVLGGAQTATLDLYGDGLLAIDVTKQVTQAPVDKDGKVVTALVTNTGTVRADGGTVLLTASAVDGVVQTLVTAGGNISAPSVGGRTGRVAVRGTGGAVLVTGGVLAQGGQPGTTGGQIELNATGTVTLASTARVDASGQAGGGTVAVGTTLARAKGGPSVVGQKTAARTTVAAGAMIAADATGKGNGGQITVLSSDGTSMAGGITARGGPQRGDGGNVEISANQGLTITGSVDTRAPAGRIGLLTIDPDTLVIGDTVVTANPATPGADGSNQLATGAQTISAATFNAFTTNVSLSASGDITLGGSTPLATATTGASVTLNAGGTLTIGTALNQSGNVTLTGGVGIVVDAPINIGVNTLTLDGGSITQGTAGTITAGRFTGGANSAVDLSIVANAISTLGPFVAPGDFTLNNGANPLTINGAVNLGTTGVLTLEAGTISEQPGGSITAGTLAGSSSGAVELSTATNAVANLGKFTATGDFSLTNGADQNLTVTGPLSANNITLGTSGTGTTGVQGAVSTTGNNTTITLTGGSGGIALNAAVGAGTGATGTIVDLITTGGGDVTQTAASGVTAAELVGNVSGSVAMSTGGSPGPTNNIAALGPFTINGSGGFVLDASATFGSLTVNGPLTATAGPVDIIRPHTLTVPGAITANGALELDAFGGNATSGLTITGTVKGPTILLVSEISGPVSLSGNASVGQSGATVTFNGGEITQDPTSVITAGTLQVTLANEVNLAGTGNAIDSLGPVTTFGFIHLTDKSALTVSGPIRLIAGNSSDDLFLQSANDITVSTPITLSAPAQVTVQAGGNLVVAAGAPISTAGSISLAAADSTIAGFNPAGKLTLNSDVGTTATAVQLSAGSGGIALNAAVGAGTGATGTIVDLITTGGGDVTQTSASGITAAELVGNVSGSVVMATLVGGSVGSPGPSNNIAALGPFTIDGGGGFVLDASGSRGTLTVTGSLSATAGGVAIIRPNTLAVPGTITANGAVELDDFGGGLTITGIVKGPTILLVSEINGNTSLLGGSSIGQGGGTVTLSSNVITQDPTSVITAGTLQVTLSGIVNLVGTGNAIDNLGPVTASGFIRLTDNSSLTVSGPIQVGADFQDGVFLQSAKDVTISTPIALAGLDQVSVQAGGTLVVAAGAPISTPGSITLSAGSGGIALGDKVSGTTGVDLTTTGGGLVSQTAAGTVSTGMLTGNPSGTVDLSAATNAVSDLGALTLGGDFALNNGTNALQVTAPINAAGHTLTLNAGAITQTAAAAIAAGTLTGGSSGAVDLSTATNAISSFGAFATGGDVTLNNGSTALQFSGAFTGGGTLTLTAGPITQSAGAAITAGTLTGTSSGAVDLSTATNAIGNLGAFAPGGNFTLNNGSIALQFTGPFAGSGETLTLNAGPVSQTAAATVMAGTLTGASSGAVDLSTATNSIGALGGFTTGGNFALNNGTNALRITAPISAAGAALTLTAGTITQAAAAVITAGALTGTSSGAVDLSAAANAIDSVGSFTAVGDFSLSTEISAQPNPVRLGTVSGGSVAVTAHDITVAGLMTASDPGGTLALTADTIAFFPGLGQLAAPNGTVRLGPVTNGIAFDIAFEPASGGLVQLANNVALQITTPTLVIGQGSGAAVAGSIAFNQPFSWPNALNLQTTGAVTQQSPIAAGVLSGLAGSVNLTGAAGNAVATLGLFRATAGDFDLTQSAPLMVAGPLSADNINLTAAGPTGGIAISGSVTAAGGNLVLAAGDQGISLQSPLTVATLDLSATGGGVTEAAGGGIDATTLQSSAGVTGSVALTTGTNNIANLSQFTVAGGDLALSDGSTALQIIGPVGAAGHTLSLAVGPVTQTASGAITAGTFTGSSSGAVDLGTATNAISALGAFTPGGNFTLNNGANALQFTGAFAGGGDTLTLTVGSITQTALGAITAGTLTGSSSGSVDLRAAGNAIATLGAFAANGIFDVLQSSPLSVTGPVSASNIILDVPGPTGGLVFSGPVTATSGLFLIAGDQGIALDAGAALTAVSAKLGAGAGGVNEAAGASLTVENLQVSGPPIGGTVDLRQGTNAVSTLGPFQVAGGDFNLVQSRPLSVVGQVSANNINLVASGVTGGINVSAPVTAANSLALTAGDAGVTLNGAIATPDLHIDASGTITQTGGSLAVGKLSGSARHLAEFAANTNVANSWRLHRHRQRLRAE